MYRLRCKGYFAIFQFISIFFVPYVCGLANTSRGSVTGVTLKIAFDSSRTDDPDGYGGVADASAIKSERFTSPESLDMVHRLRRISDCVLVGRGTVEADDCTLTVRRVPLLEGRDCQPTRVVLDPRLRLFKDVERKYQMFQDGHKVIVYHHTKDELAQSFSEKETVNLVNVSVNDELSSDMSMETPTFGIDPTSVIKSLREEFGINHVMVEGGPVTAISFLEKRLVDRAIIVKAPVAFGKPVPSKMSKRIMVNAGLECIGHYKNVGGDEIECWVRFGDNWPSEDGKLTSWP